MIAIRYHFASKEVFVAENQFPWNTPDQQQRDHLRSALVTREKELDELRNQLVQREEMIDRRSAQDKKMLERRERELADAWDKRQQYLIEQEQAILKRQEEFERHFEVERQQIDDRRREYVEEKRDLESLARTLEQERIRLTQESQQTLQDNSKRFVGAALTLLGDKEGRFHRTANWWAVGGAVALLAGVVIAVVTMLSSSDSYHQASAAGLGYYFFHLFRGLVVVGVCVALARYAFIFSNSYMHESQKVGERAHAIRFGEFYLDTYGTNAEWEQVKEAFAHWNISGQSAFSKHDPNSVDPALAGAAGKVMEKALEVASAAAKKPE